jgi:hypothetical protein
VDSAVVRGASAPRRTIRRPDGASRSDTRRKVGGVAVPPGRLPGPGCARTVSMVTEGGPTSR